MISIKRLLEQRDSDPGAERDLVEAPAQMGRLLLDAIATHMVHGNEADFQILRHKLIGLARQMDGPQSETSLPGISRTAVEAFETHCQRTTGYFREQNEERRSMVAMLTATVADLSGQTDDSVTRLQAIEKQIERASELDDIRTLRASLEESLLALREAAAQQRSSAVATVDGLRAQIAMARSRIPDDPKDPRGEQDGIDSIPELSQDLLESLSATYVAAFRLQRAEHVAARFGEAVKQKMLSVIAAQLKSVMGPHDRLLRRKGMSFVMFIHSAASIKEVRACFLGAVGRTNQQYIEVGSKSLLLSIGVDWIVFPQADRPSPEAVLAEIDAFLASTKAGTSTPVSARQ